MEGRSTLPVPAVTGAPNVAPPSVLKITLIWFTLLLMYTRNRLPNVSQAACPSQHATPVAIVPRVQVAPASVEYARKILAVPGLFEVATRLFVLVGLTLMKLSAWLRSVALTLTTGSTQVSGTNNRSVGLGARSCGITHLRVPSGTSIPPGVVATCACKMDVAGVKSAKTETSAVRWRRVFIHVFLLKWRVRVD